MNRPEDADPEGQSNATRAASEDHVSELAAESAMSWPPTGFRPDPALFAGLGVLASIGSVPLSAEGLPLPHRRLPPHRDELAGDLAESERRRALDPDVAEVMRRMGDYLEREQDRLDTIQTNLETLYQAAERAPRYSDDADWSLPRTRILAILERDDVAREYPPACYPTVSIGRLLGRIDGIRQTDPDHWGHEPFARAPLARAIGRRR
jgi:hypothetical protein